MDINRQRKIKNYRCSWYWSNQLTDIFSNMNLEFQEIVFVEELVPYESYRGFVKVKSHSQMLEFIEISVRFNKKGHPYASIHPCIIHTISSTSATGKVLFNILDKSCFS